MMCLKRQILAAFLCALMLTLPAAAQESDDSDDAEIVTDGDAADAVEETPAEDTVIEEAGLDQQGFEKEDDDDFIPSEEIGADQSIPFPTDI